MRENSAPHERAHPRLMRAVRIHQFGGPEAIAYDEVSRPAPVEGQVLVRVKAAGVGLWDAWVRAGKSALPQPLPLILGSDLSGAVEAAYCRSGYGARDAGWEAPQAPQNRLGGSCIRTRRNCMDRRLENKRALVMSGSRGIGAAIVRRLAREGAILPEDGASQSVRELTRVVTRAGRTPPGVFKGFQWMLALHEITGARAVSGRIR